MFKAQTETNGGDIGLAGVYVTASGNSRKARQPLNSQSGDQ